MEYALGKGKRRLPNLVKHHKTLSGSTVLNWGTALIPSVCYRKVFETLALLSAIIKKTLVVVLSLLPTSEIRPQISVHFCSAHIVRDEWLFIPWT